MKWGRLSLVLGLVLAVAGLLTWALWGKLEWAEREVWVGYSGEARVNDFLAAQRLLEKMGQRATSIRGLPSAQHMPGRNDVMILPQRQVRISPGQADTLMAWVRKGGLLIAEGLIAESRTADVTQDPIFAAVGARMVWRPERGAEGSNIGMGTAPDIDMKAFDEKNRTVTVTLDGQDYRARLGAWQELVDRKGQAVASAGNDSGIKMLQYDLDHGRVILCTDLSALANGNIAEEDHAGFLSALATDWARNNRAWIVYREEPPSLWGWLRDRAWMILIALGALMAAALWSAAARFGPRVPDPAESRRSLLEHLTACGRFQWAQRRGEPLLEATRNAMWTRLHQAHPGWAQLDPPELCSRLAVHSGLSEARVMRALHQDALADPTAFTEAIQTLALLRKQL